MRVRVLGAAAGGGFPQWNCACENCGLSRRGDPRVRARTQDSIAISGDSPDTHAGEPGREEWVVVNASPDVHAQIARTSELQPRRPRHTPIAAIVLTNGDLDHVLGLFSLRESQPLVVYATDAVRRGLLEGNVMMRTLARFEGQLSWRRLVLGEDVALPCGLSVRALAAPGKLPVHLVGRARESDEDNVALVVTHASTSKRLVYAASAGALGPFTASFVDADCVLFDGTFWSSDELVRLGLGTSRAEDMAHLPVGGEDGSLARLALAKVRRKIYTHINNTNPILRDDSDERRAVERAGWEVAFDGMEIAP